MTTQTDLGPAPDLNDRPAFAEWLRRAAAEMSGPGKSLGAEGLHRAAAFVDNVPAKIDKDENGPGVACGHCGSLDVDGAAWEPGRYSIRQGTDGEGVACWLCWQESVYEAAGETHVYCGSCHKLSTLDGVPHDYS